MEHQKEKNMKKLIATVLVAMITFAAFAAIHVTIDTITQYAGPNELIEPLNEWSEGFSIIGADDGVFADMNATLSGRSASALLNIRFKMPLYKNNGTAIEVHAWEITAKVTDWLKLSIGNTAYEIYAESISWEPLFGAGFFEQGRNRIYLDMNFGDIRALAGMSMGQDKKKPWNTFQGALFYDIGGTMMLSTEFSMVSTEMCLESYNDGECKTLSFHADYYGTENLDVVGGYSMILAEGQIVQHRAEMFATYYTEKMGIELFDSFLIRRYAGTGKGNRLGLQLSLYANEALTPFVKLNWFKNYGYSATIGGFAWGDCQLEGPGIGKQYMILEPGVRFVLTENVSGSLSASLKFNLSEGAEKKFYWAIPLGLTAAF